MKYIVVWVDTKTGERGHGQPLEYELAKSACEYLNDQAPHIDHRTVPEDIFNWKMKDKFDQIELLENKLIS